MEILKYHNYAHSAKNLDSSQIVKSKFLNLQSTNNLQKTKGIICNTLYWVVNKSEMNTPKSKGDVSLKENSLFLQVTWKEL